MRPDAHGPCGGSSMLKLGSLPGILIIGTIDDLIGGMRDENR
jgi:hypothetical protein